jgi:cation transport regulator ChaC
VASPDGDATCVWYFGYGSNVDRGTFLGRRRMRPLAAEVAVLDGWSLCFDLPVGPGERGVANLRPESGARTWGVCWQIPHAQAEHLDRSEGVPQGAYRRQAVEVATREGARLAAFTYCSERGVSGRKPSRRYLGLMLAGAREHGLPEEWVTFLRGLELAVDERDPQAELFDPGRRGSGR